MMRIVVLFLFALLILSYYNQYKLKCNFIQLSEGYDMKKMYFAKFYAILLLAILVAACSSKKSDIAYYIPNNAGLVININMGKMHEKGKLAEFDKTKMYTQGISLLAMADVKIQKLVTDIMKNTEELGLDLKGEAYMYMNDSYFGMIVPMKNKEKYVSFVKKQADAFGSKEEPHKIENFLGVSKDNSVFAWNDDVLYFLVGINNQTAQQAEADFKKIVTQKDEESIISHPKYKEFSESKKDISIMIMMDPLLKFTEKMNSEVNQFKGLLSIYAGTSVNYYVEFANDEIIINSTQELSPKLKKMFDMNKISKTPISDKLLKLFPANSIAAISMGANATEAVKAYQELLKTMLADAPNTQETAEQLAMFNMIMTQAAPYLNKLDGETLIALTDFKQSNLNLSEGAMSMYGMPEPPMPMFGIALGISDNTVLDQLVAAYQLPFKKEGAAYKITISEEFSMYAVNANNVLMFTNDPELAKATEAGQIANNLTNSAFKNDLMKGAFGYMNLNLDTYPESAKAYIASDAFLNSLKDKLNGFEMITASTDLKTMKSTSTIKFKKTGTNAFYSMIQMIEKSI